MSGAVLAGWESLRHGGLLLDPQRLRTVAAQAPEPLSPYLERELRRRAAAELDGSASSFVAFVLEHVCGFDARQGAWQRGPQVPPEWTRRAVTGEAIKPRHLWRGPSGATLPVFFDDAARLGIGRGRRATSHVLQWLRGGPERLALLTNGRQWRLAFATLDVDAWCEWDVDLWFEEGALSPQVDALRTLLQPSLWTPPAPGGPPPLVQAVLDSRKGQADLSTTLGERAREAVELLVQAHGEPLKERCADVDPADIYRAAVRVVMRLVVVLFAESRELLPRESALYHSAYGLTGLLEDLEKLAARGGSRLARSYGAWPRILALFRLVRQGSHHEALPVPEYGGELFAPGDAASPDGLARALAVFETACFERELLPDRDVYRILERITRTRVKLRQGRASAWMPAPVDFSDLSSEYIGILFEGLLDFELKTAPAGDPVIFLAVGNQPALPLSRLEAMDDKALANLLEKMKDTSSSSDDEQDDSAEQQEDEAAGGDDGGDDDHDHHNDEDEEDEGHDDDGGADDDPEDERHTTRTRAEVWARRAVEVGKLVRTPRGALTAEKRRAHEEAVGRKARQLVTRVILPGEWYLVRWGGTRKGSGTFYTRPGLAVPTVQRTLRPLAYDPPQGPDGEPDRDAQQSQWTPKRPEEILALKVCDPACGSGSFLLGALRFLTDALYVSLHHHGRVCGDGERSVVALLQGAKRGGDGELLREELLPCRPDDPLFEPRLKAVLRRHVVERCLYGVDLDAVAVELCRLALWVETMDRELPFSFLDHKVKRGNALVGAWFDTFRHYPVMAWKNREGGDKNHTNGVHFEKEARTRAIKAFVKDRLTPDLRDALSGQLRLFAPPATTAEAVHDEALALLARLHEMPVQDAAERARVYREELLGSPAYRALAEAMDLWCACWFWPAGELEHAPLPSTFADPPGATRAVVQSLAARNRFFHWELEFPDVFTRAGSGFDVILGNPPWDIAKPNSKEFFSNVDPLYRAYGKQEALAYQTTYFEAEQVEADWLDYSAGFRAQSNFLGYAASPFGDPDSSGSNQDRFTIKRGNANDEFHALWRRRRAKSGGYADPAHPYRHQGSADVNLYKAFLEKAHALLRGGGRLGFVVPSGLYSDHGTGPLRRLFLDACRWEWLFGFENREKIFDIDSRLKFNTVIVEKDGATDAIRTAFMRRRLEDWERAEELTTPYTRAQVDRFSPRSQVILEIQSARDLEILEKIYANSVLLGDDGPDGWGITYSTEFHMTNDSKLFPPRPKWEAQGYRPDEYSRWLKGDWLPIEELWAELGIDPSRVVPAEVELEDRLFDSSAGPDRRQAEVRFVHGHLLKPGDVARTDWRRRCAQPPYDALPIPRADIPAGIIISRHADAWIREDRIEDTALPLYEGRMIGQFDFSEKGWVSGKGRSAVWCEIGWDGKRVEPQYLMDLGTCGEAGVLGPKLPLMNITSATNARTVVGAFAQDLPCNHSLNPLRARGLKHLLALSGVLNSLTLDAQARVRLGGLNLSFFVLDEVAAIRPTQETVERLTRACAALSMGSHWFSPAWLSIGLPGAPCVRAWRALWAAGDAERRRSKVHPDALIAALAGHGSTEVAWLIQGCDHPLAAIGDPRQSGALSPKGFWRVDKDKDPELRHTVLTLVAFHDLEEKIKAHGGDRDKGIEAFLNQNDGEGWMLPETLRLADYGLGHDDRAKHPQPVASRLGPRFYDWQLTQSADESWRECHLHARNLLGDAGYKSLLAQLDGNADTDAPAAEEQDSEDDRRDPGQMRLF